MGKRGISAGQRRESAERRVPLGGSLFRGAALEVPDDSLQAWPAASIAAFNGHGFLVRKPHWFRSAIAADAAVGLNDKLSYGALKLGGHGTGVRRAAGNVAAVVVLP